VSYVVGLKRDIFTRVEVMSPATLRRYAHEAGFSKVEILPIEHDFWRSYRLFT
jgi:hypothetical protein